MTADVLVTRYEADVTDYVAGGNKVVSTTGKISNAISTYGIPIVQAFAGAIVGATAALAGLAYMSSQKAAEFDALVKSLEAVEGGADKAKRAMEELRDIAKLPGLGLQEAIQGYANLRRNGMGEDQLFRLLRAAGNANALAGGGRDELQRILLAFSQIQTNGQIAGDELNQLAEAGIAAKKMIKDRFGTADGGELMKIGVDSNVAIAALIEEMEKLPTAGDSAKNTLENLQMAVDQALVSIGTAFNGNFMPFISDVTKALEEMEASGALAGIGEALADLFTAVMPEGITTTEGLTEVMLDGIQAIATTTAMLRNFYLHVGELGSKLSDLLKILPGAQWGVEAGKGIVNGVAGDGSGGSDPISEGKRARALAEDRIAANKKKRENKQDDAKLEDPIVKLDPPTNQIFAAIERNTQRIADVMENKTLFGTKYDTFLNPVNLSRIGGGSASRMAQKGGTYMAAAGAMQFADLIRRR